MQTLLNSIATVHALLEYPPNIFGIQNVLLITHTIYT